MKNNWRADLIGFIAVGGFAAVCIIILNGGIISESMKEVGLVLIGQLSMKFGTIVDYYYGSSMSSAIKQQSIEDSAARDRQSRNIPCNHDKPKSD